MLTIVATFTVLRRNSFYAAEYALRLLIKAAPQAPALALGLCVGEGLPSTGPDPGPGRKLARKARAHDRRACQARGAIVAVAPQPGLDATRRNRCPLVTTGQALASSYRARRRSRYFSRLYPGIDQLTAFR